MLVAESQIRALEIAQASRLAAADNWGIRWASGKFALYFSMVVFVSAFPQWGWSVYALRKAVDEWEGRIILSLFRLSAVSTAMGVIRR